MSAKTDIEEFLVSFPKRMQKAREHIDGIIGDGRTLLSVLSRNGLEADYESLWEAFESFFEGYEDVRTEIAEATPRLKEAARHIDSPRKSGAKRETPKPVKPAGVTPATMSVRQFAEEALSITETIPKNEPVKGGWGDHKVFLWQVRENMNLPKERFDALAIAANREGLISLARFDLPAALPSKELIDKVNAGGIGEQFHVILRKK